MTIVTSMQAEAPVLAPEPVPPQAPPAPEPTPEPQTAPPPPPRPAPPKPEPKPAQTHAAAKPAPQTPSRNIDSEFGSLMSRYDQKTAKAGHPKAIPATQTRAAAAPKLAMTAAQQSAALAGLADKLGRLWHIDCEAAGTRGLVARVTFRVRGDGRLDGDPVLEGDNRNAPLAATAARQVVKAQQPYSTADIPMALRGESITVNFKGATACAGH